MSVTIKVFADLGITGLAGTAGFTTRLVSDNSLIQSRASSVGTVVAATEGTGYRGTFTGNDGTDYLITWDDGAGTPNYLPGYIVNTTPPANVTEIAGSAARNGDGTAAAITSANITLDSTDPANASNLQGWQVQILTATTGAGQVATVSSSTTSATKPVTPNWPVTPTGTVVYGLIPPANVTAGGSSPTASQIATAVWQDTTSGDFTTAGSPGRLLINQLAGAFTGTGSVFTTGSLANAPTGGVTLSQLNTQLAAGLVTLATDAISAASVSVGAVNKFQAGLATPTNITGGTISNVGTVGTTTNLTNAPTNGDFTAAMKTSLNAATPTVFLAASGLNNVMIETNYNLKQAVKVILAACGNIIIGNGTTAVTVGNAALPAPTTGSNTVITATMTGVAIVNGVPTAVDRTAITGIVLSNA